MSEQTTFVEVDGRRVEVKAFRPEPAYRALARSRRERAAAGANAAGVEAIVSPMQGTVVEVRVADGDRLDAGAVICVVEAMKMENEVTAHRAGVVSGLAVTAGGPVAAGQVICRVGEG